MTMGAWLLRWRAASRLTQAEVSRRTGIVQHQISRLEHDEIERPSMRDIVRLVSIYGVTPNEVAETIYGWSPPKHWKSEDYRWSVVQTFLATCTDKSRGAFLQDAYDKANWLEELERAS